MSGFARKLNRQSHLALYYQLKHILLAQIDEGLYKDGDRLPSESELIQEYKVSRHVIRQALKDLVAEGRIIARQGSGYFVNKKRFRKALPRLGSHTASMAALGRSTQTLVVAQEIKSPPDFIAICLLPPGENQSIFIKRVSYLDDEPVCLLEAYYPLKFSAALLNTNLNNQSIYSQLHQCCSITPKRAESIVSVVFADEERGSLLNIREGTPLLNLSSFTYSNADEVFEYSSGYYRIDRFELEFEQT
jgi:GntR family transcriptional regulator